MITLIADNEVVPIELVEFSDGALTCKIDEKIKKAENYVSISVCPTTPVKQILTELGLVLNAIDMTFLKAILNLPYLPYGRADRRFQEGNPHPLFVFLDDLEYFGFCEINICDPHSNYYCDAFPDLNWKVKDQLKCFLESVQRYDFKLPQHNCWDYVIAPDKGAKDKAKSIGDYLNIPTIQATKERDLDSGKIINTTFDQKLPKGSKVIICDDIGDGLGTFIPLAQKLKDMGCSVDLYLTHLIASKGLDILKGLVDNLYYYQIVGTHINRCDVDKFNKTR